MYYFGTYVHEVACAYGLSKPAVGRTKGLVLVEEIVGSVKVAPTAAEEVVTGVFKGIKRVSVVLVNASVRVDTMTV